MNRPSVYLIIDNCSSHRWLQGNCLVRGGRIREELAQSRNPGTVSLKSGQSNSKLKINWELNQQRMEARGTRCIKGSMIKESWTSMVGNNRSQTQNLNMHQCQSFRHSTATQQEKWEGSWQFCSLHTLFSSYAPWSWVCLYPCTSAFLLSITLSNEMITITQRSKEAKIEE